MFHLRKFLAKRTGNYTRLRVQQVQKSRKFGKSHIIYNKEICSNNVCKPPVEVHELSIPVPYGTIAAKAWGRANGFPVLAFHGWMDNCGTFDKLIPLLSNTLYVVAVDAPGHGMSSHKPLGSFYSYLDIIVDLKRIPDYLGWTKFSIIGHSMGGAIALFYASLFPEEVEKLVILDIVKPQSVSVKELPYVAAEIIKNNLEVEKKLLRDPPLYSTESAIQRLKKGMFDEITEESAQILITRGTRLSDCGQGLIFTRDLRLRSIEEFQKCGHEAMKAYMSGIKAKTLMILANNTHPFYREPTPEVMGDFIEIYRKNCKQFLLKTVEGNHFVHLNHPEKISHLINDFFK